MGINRLPEFWPEWNVSDILGEGAYGKVYKATKKSRGVLSQSAIKVISVPTSNAEFEALCSEGMSDIESKNYLEDIVKDFSNEIKLMEKLKGAPHIAAVEDYMILEKQDRVGWDIYIRMELLESFKDYSRRTTLDEAEILRMGIEIASALEICHEKNIIHRDIKPANIFISKFNEYKISDFGVAKELSMTMGTLSAKGTYSYMAPEVAQGKRYDSTVDTYSLGIVIYTLLNNNRQPFIDPNISRITYNDRQNANNRRLSGEPLPPPINASKELSDIILTACSYDPKKRYRSATEFENALNAYLNTPKASAIKEESVSESDYEETVAIKHSNIQPANTENKPEIIKESNTPIRFVYTDEGIPEPEYSQGAKTLPLLFGYSLRKIGGLLIFMILITMVISLLSNIFYSDTKEESSSYTYEGAVLTIHSFDENITLPNTAIKVIIEEGNTSVPRNAFSNFKALEAVTIPESCTEIGSGAFSGCSSLKTLYIPDSIVQIDSNAFKDCSSLTEVTLPEGLTSISSYTFFGCSSLEKINISLSDGEIGDWAFGHCSSLREVRINEAADIGAWAFEGCTSLEELHISDSVESIDERAFKINSTGEFMDNIKIFCPEDSYAHKFAEKYSIIHIITE